MRSRLRENVVPIAMAGIASVVVGWLTLYAWALTDYDFEARPSFDALVHGHLLRFLQLAPAYGGSLVMRAPFVLLTKVWSGGELSIYRAAAAPCLIAAAILGVWLVASLRAQGYTRGARAVTLALCVASPLTLPALEAGHPEELLGAVLCVGAVLVASRNRPVWGGVLLGLAIANKEWALLAIGPVALALPERRVLGLMTAGFVTAIVVAPLFAAGHFATQVNGAATQATVVFNPWQIWWFLGSHVHTLRDAAGNIVPGHRWDHRVEPTWVGIVSHPIIVALTLPLTLLCVRLRRRGAGRPVHEALLLLTLLLLLRCLLDPWDLSYYALPFLLALLAWEALTFKRSPALSLAASLVAWFVLQYAVPSHGFSPDMQSLLFDACAIPTVAALSLGLYAPGLRHRFSLRIGRRAAVPTPA